MEFFFLDWSSNEEAADWDEDSATFDSVRCPLKPQTHVSLQRKGKLKIVLKHAPGPEVVKTLYSDLLVQEHVLDYFKHLGLSGFQATPADARYRKRSFGAAPTYFELRVTGFAGVAAPESGVTVIDGPCEGCGRSTYSAASRPEHLIDLSHWDGSDFFTVWPYSKTIFVSEKVKNAFYERRFRGVHVLPLEWLRDPHMLPNQPMAAGRLSRWFSQERARELSRRFGLPE
jgi:hypothetical protein